MIASRHPNGAIAAATLTRISPDRAFYHPLADVTLDLPKFDLPLTVGIFGLYKPLSLVLPVPLTKPRVLAQDLAGDTAFDTSGSVHIRNRELIFEGDVLHRWGTHAASAGDLSDPGLVIRISRG